ncbi:uncharacterized protein LOC143246392 isoform X1 [Tachypleus tridentatus]|uniref:uncharacterized protein LOC143246392 isoform X1 n=1 Tax=Tachypleus tridentatus TaxID=6853 RepID=UPI003FD472B4
MTVSYTAEVATSRGLGCFWKLLFRWRGSIYKLLWPELCLYLFVYYLINIIYRTSLNDSSKSYFEKIVVYCATFSNLIPISFVLGFYVSLIIKRWWDSFSSIPWPDNMAFYVSAFIHGQDERGRLMRRTIMRYVNLAFIITLTCISPAVKKRFPTLDHLVEAGVLLANEKEVIDHLKTPHPIYWMPLIWASSICIRARKEGRVRDDFALKTLVDEIAKYRGKCGDLFNYDWISIPLVYTQVVTLAVYTYFLAALMGSQMLDPEKGYDNHHVDIYVPIFNFLQFFFYMGWLKVAEVLINPFGEDDDDFELHWIIDRDIQFSYLVVDEMHQEHPELIKDQYWDEVMPPDLPYTVASRHFYSEPPQGSAASIIVPPDEAEFLPPVEEEEKDTTELETKLNIPYSLPVKRLHGSRPLSFGSRSTLMGSSYRRNAPWSMLNKMLGRDNSVSGSNMSLQSSRRGKHSRGTLGSMPKDIASSQMTSQSPLPTPSSTIPEFQEDIFRMSEISLSDARTTQLAQNSVASSISNLQGKHSSHQIPLAKHTIASEYPIKMGHSEDLLRGSSVKLRPKMPSMKDFGRLRKRNSIALCESENTDEQQRTSDKSNKTRHNSGSQTSIQTAIYQEDSDYDIPFSSQDQEENVHQGQKNILRMKHKFHMARKINKSTPSVTRSPTGSFVTLISTSKHGRNASTTSIIANSAEENPVKNVLFRHRDSLLSTANKIASSLSLKPRRSVSVADSSSEVKVEPGQHHATWQQNVKTGSHPSSPGEDFEEYDNEETLTQASNAGLLAMLMKFQQEQNIRYSQENMNGQSLKSIGDINTKNMSSDIYSSDGFINTSKDSVASSIHGKVDYSSELLEDMELEPPDIDLSSTEQNTLVTNV